MSLTDAERRLGWYDLRFTPDARKVATACTVCGKAMYLPASKVADFQRCSRECSNAHRAAARQERAKPCATCGETFIPRPWLLRQGYGNYCSQACNKPAQEALNTPEACAKRVAARKRSIADGLWAPKRGEEVHNWKGGPKAYRQRRRDSGAEAAGLRAYRAKNPDKVREFAQRRSSRKIGRLPRGTIKRLVTLQRERCAICRTSLKAGYHLDHIMPLALGGEHAPRNLQLLCETCNVRKNAKHPLAYMRELGRLL